MNRFFQWTYLTVIYIFLYIPIVILIVYSFNNAAFSAAWHGATLKWYKTLFQDPNLLLFTRNSLVIATLAPTFATIFGLLGSMALFQYRFWFSRLLNGLVFTLITAPDLMLGIALLILFTLLKFPLGFFSLLIAHITFCLPFVVVTIYGRMKTLDLNIFESARDLGAADFTIFCRILLPLMIPALIAGWLLSFTLSIDDVIISFFVSGPTFQILPIYIYSQARTGITPEINALCTLILIFTALIVIAAQFLIRKKQVKL